MMVDSGHGVFGCAETRGSGETVMGEEAGISDRHWDTGILAPSLLCSGL